MRLYDHPASGNCLKCRILLRQLGLDCETVEVDLFRGETRTPEHFARTPDGRVPVLALDDGTTIPSPARSCCTSPRARRCSPPTGSPPRAGPRGCVLWRTPGRGRAP